MDRLDDEHPQRTSIQQPRRLGPPNQFTFHHIHQFLPPTIEVSYTIGGKLQQKQGPFGSLGIFQDPDAPSRGTGQDHVQSLSYHAEGTCKVIPFGLKTLGRCTKD